MGEDKRRSVVATRHTELVKQSHKQHRTWASFQAFDQRGHPGMPCEMHSVDATSASAVTVVPEHPASTGTMAGACVCLHRKRTLDTLRQRLARRLKRARRHRHDVTDDTCTGDDVSDDVDTLAGELPRNMAVTVELFAQRSLLIPNHRMTDSTAVHFQTRDYRSQRDTVWSYRR